MSTPALVPGAHQLPSVEWLLIHGAGGLGTVELVRSTPDEQPDDEGRVSNVETRTSVRGFASLLSQEEVGFAGTIGVSAQAALAVARGNDVDETDGVELTGIDPSLDGRWAVTAVRTTPVHMRLLLDRQVDVGG